MSSEDKQANIGLIKTLNEKMDALAVDIEKIKVAEYVDMINNPRRLLFLNFLAGVSRGLGMAIGFTILGAVVLIIMRELVVLNLPVIGGFIAEVVRMVQTHLRM